jgi:subtilase family serine protease
MFTPRTRLRSSALGTTLFAVLTVMVGIGFSQHTNNAAQLLSKAQNLGPEDQSKQITVTVWLKQHNQASLDELVKQIYTKGSPNYHHFLTREQYNAKFAPNAQESATVREFLQAHNFRVTSVDKNNHYVMAEGRVGDAQNAFNVQISLYKINGQVHRINTSEYSIIGPVSALVKAVHGLNDLAAVPASVRPINPETGKTFAPQPLAAAAANATAAVAGNPCLHGIQTFKFTTPGGGPSAIYTGNRYATDTTNTCPGFTPPQVQAAYGLNSVYKKGWDGTGQTVIIVDAYGSPTIMDDANTFSSLYGLPALNSSNFTIAYPGGQPTVFNSGWAGETTLDVEWVHSVAPGANIVLVVTPDNSSLDVGVFWAIDNPYGSTPLLGTSLSASWSSSELLNLLFGYEDELKIQNSYNQLAAAIGMSANYATGDYGDYVQDYLNLYGLNLPPSVQMPASSPYATAIGGTSLFVNNTNHIQFQTGWGNNETRLTYASPNAPYDPPLELGFIYGAGGGTSAYWAKPSYQNSLSGDFRQIPDIGYLADPYTGVNIVITPSGVVGDPQYFEVIGGTSLATPMFSGLWAIANQAAGTASPLGQAAPYLYSLPAGAISDVLAVDNGHDVKGKIYAPKTPVLIESAADLAQPLENTTTFLSAFYHGSSTRYYDLTFGTDSSLVTGTGWDNVTGVGTPNGLAFIQGVVAEASAP